MRMIVRQVDGVSAQDRIAGWNSDPPVVCCQAAWLVKRCPPGKGMALLPLTSRTVCFGPSICRRLVVDARDEEDEPDSRFPNRVRRSRSRPRHSSEMVEL